jgi:hypothetical protein
MDKNSIKYPIDDKLIKQMPDLHGAHMVKDAPVLNTILMDTVDFENLLYIWEFLINFSDFLDIPKFYI